MTTDRGAGSQAVEQSPGATLLSQEDQQTLWDLTTPDQNNDQGGIVVDCGAYNVGVNVQHRVTPNPARLAFHAKVTEIYYVTDGSATFVTAGGPMTNVEMRPYSIERVVETNGNGMAGPGGSATYTNPPQQHKLKRGDVIILPPFTGHYLSEIDSAFRYLVFRVDPERTLPAGFVNSYIKP